MKLGLLRVARGCLFLHIGTQIVGVILAAVASVISNLGLNFQKLSHTNAHVSAEADSSRNYTSDRTWILGVSLIIFGSLPQLFHSQLFHIRSFTLTSTPTAFEFFSLSCVGAGMRPGADSFHEIERGIAMAQVLCLTLLRWRLHRSQSLPHWDH